MKKQEIVNKISERFNVPKWVVKEVVDVILDEIIENTMKKGRTEIRGFGSFKLRHRNGHFSKNPRTGIEVFVEGRYYITFKPSKKLLEKLNGKV